MKKQARDAHNRRRRATPAARLIKWTVVLAVLALAIYGLSQTAGVAYDEDDIRVVNFSSLSSGARRAVLRQANRDRCTCGCGMNLAQCVATDMTCPVRDRNIDTIRAMVREAGSP